MNLNILLTTSGLTGGAVLLYTFLAPQNLWLYFAVILLLNTGGLLIYAQHNHKITALQRRTDEHASAMDPTLRIANETLPYLRRGLNVNTARQTAEIIQKISEVAAVAITDREQVLAYLGAGCEKHHPGDRILTEATLEVISTGEHKLVSSARQLNCTVKNCSCPLGSAIITPLKLRSEVIGTVKLYQTREGGLPAHTVRLAIGIAQILSVQMELAELDRQNQLLTLARLDALHAQINPHFLFNTLNTIIMYSRTNPNRARRLLIHLAEFFRRSLKNHDHFTTLREEMETVHTYLVLEKARFGDKLKVIQDIEESLLDYSVPVLSIQPLVENSIKHGITAKVGTGAVKVAAYLENSQLKVSVTDDGIGIPPEKLPLILQHGYGSGNGVGLSNVNERLQNLYGEQFGLQVISEVDKETTVQFYVPLREGTSQSSVKEGLV